MKSLLIIPALLAAALIYISVDRGAGLSTWMRDRDALENSTDEIAHLEAEIVRLKAEVSQLESDPFSTPVVTSSATWCTNVLRAFGPHLTGCERAFLELNAGEELDSMITLPRFLEIMRRVSVAVVGEEIEARQAVVDGRSGNYTA